MNSIEIKDKTHVIKWVSACTILIAMVFHVLGLTPWNSIFQLIGASGWTYVGFKWKESSIMMNFLPQFFYYHTRINIFVFL